DLEQRTMRHAAAGLRRGANLPARDGAAGRQLRHGRPAALPAVDVLVGAGVSPDRFRTLRPDPYLRQLPVRHALERQPLRPRHRAAAGLRAGPILERPVLRADRAAEMPAFAEMGRDEMRADLLPAC